MGLGFGISTSVFDKRREIEILQKDNPRELRLFSGYTAATLIPVPIPSNPKSDNYQILDYKESDNFLVVKIKYLDCTNFEGEKILVYKNIKVIDLWNQKLIDPHFSENKDYHSPIARFIPTQEGWNMAIVFINAMKQQ